MLTSSLASSPPKCCPPWTYRGRNISPSTMASSIDDDAHFRHDDLCRHCGCPFPPWTLAFHTRIGTPPHQIYKESERYREQELREREREKGHRSHQIGASLHRDQLCPSYNGGYVPAGGGCSNVQGNQHVLGVEGRGGGAPHCHTQALTPSLLTSLLASSPPRRC
jgi:hypothetical protein